MQLQDTTNDITLSEEEDYDQDLFQQQLDEISLDEEPEEQNCGCN